jgi:hypothetical protein
MGALMAYISIFSFFILPHLPVCVCGKRKNQFYHAIKFSWVAEFPLRNVFFHPLSLSASHKNVFLVLNVMYHATRKAMIPTTPLDSYICFARKHLYASYSMYCWPRFSNAISIFSPWTHTFEWSQETPTTAILGSILESKKTQGNAAEIKHSKHIAGKKCSTVSHTLAE